MATNVTHAEGNQLKVPVASGVASGDPVLFGSQPTVALTDRGTDGEATLKFDGVADFTLPAGPHSAGDAVYHDGSDTLTVTNTDTFYGIIVVAVLTGVTTARVRLGGIAPAVGS